MNTNTHTHTHTYMNTHTHTHTESPRVHQTQAVCPLTDLTEEDTTTDPPEATASPNLSAPAHTGHQGNKDGGDGNVDDAKRHMSKRQLRADHESKVREVLRHAYHEETYA